MQAIEDELELAFEKNVPKGAALNIPLGCCLDPEHACAQSRGSGGVASLDEETNSKCKGGAMKIRGEKLALGTRPLTTSKVDSVEMMKAINPITSSNGGPDAIRSSVMGTSCVPEPAHDWRFPAREKVMGSRYIIMFEAVLESVAATHWIVVFKGKRQENRKLVDKTIDNCKAYRCRGIS